METSQFTEQNIYSFHFHICNKLLVSNEELMKHLKCHTGMEAFHCIECDRISYKSVFWNTFRE